MVVVLVVCCYVLFLFLLSDDNTGTAFLIHVIIESVTTASKGSEKTWVLQTFPVRGLDMLEAIDKGARLPG